MRKLFSLFMALLATTCLWAHDFEVDGIYYNYLDDNNVEVTYRGGYFGSYDNEYSSAVSIPSTVTYNGTTYNVTSIGWDAFSFCSSLTSITIGNSITSIGECAFYGCSSLTSVTIGNNVTSIGEYAFSFCSSLTSITIPNSVTSIGSNAFAGCSSLNSITIPNSVTSIGDWAFYNCSSLTSPVYNAHCFAYMPTSYSGAYTIPEGIEQIAGGAFRGCSSLTSITIPNSVTTVGGGTFYSCHKLESVVLSNNIISLPCYSQKQYHGSNEWYDIYGFFENCFSLTSLTIPNSVTSIGDKAFYQCTSLTSITIPNSVTSIGDLAFSACSSLTSITIPNSVTTVGGGMFSRCEKLESVVLSNNMISLPCYSQKYWQNYAGWVYVIRGFFEDCSSLTSVTIPNSVTSIGDYTFKYCDSLSSVAIGNGVTHIDEYAFYGCTGLNLLRLGTGIQSIAADAFSDCTKLYDIYCLAAEPPTGYTSSFANYNAFLHVLCESQRLYMLDVLFGEFKYIECISSDEVTTDDIVITPGLTDVTIIWPSEDYADTYTIVIKKGNEVFCTLTFNADGQLFNIAFAPGRDGNHPAQYAEQAGNGYRFTVTGLEEGTQYAYNITTKDAANKTIATYSGEFTTMGGTTTAVEDILQNTTNVQKLLRNGQLIIVRDGVEYNAMGQEL